MTDKSKPWLHAKHPEAIACQKAGIELSILLEKEGIDYTAFGVGVSDDNQEAVIHFFLLEEEDKVKVPNPFNGYQVKVSVAGRAEAL